MKRRVPLAVIFAIALAIAALLPLYVERTMTRVTYVDRRAEAIEWGWKLCTLRGYYADRRYMRREQKPAVWFAVNVGLAFAYATVLTFAARRAFRSTRE